MRLSSKLFISIFVEFFILVLILLGGNQRVLGFDLIILFLPCLIIIFGTVIAFVATSIYELFQTIKQKEIQQKEKDDLEKGPTISREQCYYHKKQAIVQCEKCKHFICNDCVMVFNYPFSGTLLAFTEDVGVKKHIYCPICHWKSVSEMASSWSIRIAHLFTLFILIIMLIMFFEGFIKPVTATFSTPLIVDEWIILLFLAMFPIFFIGMGSLILYSLLIDAPKRTNKAKLELQKFLNERE